MRAQNCCPMAATRTQCPARRRRGHSPHNDYLGPDPCATTTTQTHSPRHDDESVGAVPPHRDDGTAGTVGPRDDDDYTRPETLHDNHACTGPPRGNDMATEPVRDDEDEGPEPPADDEDAGPELSNIDSGLKPLRDDDDAGTEPTSSSSRMGSTELPRGDDTATEPCATTKTWVHNTRAATTARAPSLRETTTTRAQSPCETTTARWRLHGPRSPCVTTTTRTQGHRETTTTGTQSRCAMMMTRTQGHRAMTSPHAQNRCATTTRAGPPRDVHALTGPCDHAATTTRPHSPPRENENTPSPVMTTCIL